MLNCTLIYRRLGECVTENFDDVESALARSTEILIQRWGVPVCVTHADCELFDQEALFSDYCNSTAS